MTKFTQGVGQMAGGLAILIIGVLTGILTGVLICRYSLLKIESALSVGSILQSIITVVSAWFITLYLQKMAGDNRKQKELFLDQFAEMRLLIDELECIKNDSQSELVRVVALLKRMKQKNQLIQRCMKERSIIIDGADLSEFIIKLREVCTTTPSKKTLEDFANTENCPAYVKEGIIIWSMETVTAIEAAIQECKEAVFRAQLKMNVL